MLVKIKYILILFITLFCLSGCKNTNREILLPSVTGEANSVLVVISGPDNKSDAGNIIRNKLGQFLPGLPQEEPLFDLSYVPHNLFNKVYKKQRNILITFIGPDYKEKLIVQNNKWAQPQLIITLMAPNKEAFVKIFETKALEIINRINDAENSRLTDGFRKSTEKDIYSHLYTKHKIKINVPKGFSINTDTTNFIWIGNEYRDIVEGILVYYYPYTDTNNFNKENLIEKRNEIAKKYVPGEVEGSYMTTEIRFPIEINRFENKQNRFSVELRGLWMMKNGAAMGGPFVSLTQFDNKNNRIVTAEGFVFAPAHEKRNIIRRLEAIISTTDF